jgi:hypothetical protein
MSPLRDAIFMSALLDVVLPASADGRMPAAGTIGIDSALADAIAADQRSTARVTAGLVALLEATPDFASLPAIGRVQALNAQLEVHPGFMRALLRHLYLAYYQHPVVLEALGEPARPPFPEGFELEPTDPELLAKLIDRA